MESIADLLKLKRRSTGQGAHALAKTHYQSGNLRVVFVYVIAKLFR